MKKTQLLPRRFTILAALAAFVFPVGAATTTFTATGDNTMLSGNLANNNYGATNPISSGTVVGYDQRSVLRFDVSALDGLYTSIDSITLRLHYFDDSSLNTGNAEVSTDVHAVSAANRAWTEGASTWNSPWVGSGGLGTAGTDYDSTVLASRTIDLSGTNRPAVGSALDFNFTGTSAQLAALIDTWMVDNVGNAQDNPGLLLRDPSPTFNGNLRNRLTASSTEDANAALRPQLIVNYTAIPEPSSALLLSLGGLGLVLLRRR